MTEKSTPNTQQQPSAMSPTKEELGKVLLQQQKLASLGMLSAGIAHEIQNPLNFVINFSKMSEKLIDDLKEVVNDVREHIPEDDANELDDITTDLNVNLQKIRVRENSFRAWRLRPASLRPISAIAFAKALSFS